MEKTMEDKVHGVAEELLPTKTCSRSPPRHRTLFWKRPTCVCVTDCVHFRRGRKATWRFINRLFTVDKMVTHGTFSHQALD